MERNAFPRDICGAFRRQAVVVANRPESCTLASSKREICNAAVFYAREEAFDPHRSSRRDLSRTVFSVSNGTWNRQHEGLPFSEQGSSQHEVKGTNKLKTKIRKHVELNGNCRRKDKRIIRHYVGVVANDLILKKVVDRASSQHSSCS